jgi:hypothetical protein
MSVHSTDTGQEITLTGIDIVMYVQFLITLTGIDIVMYVQFLITSAKYCLSYFIYLQVGLHCTKPVRPFNLNICIPVLFCHCLCMLKINVNKYFLPIENYWKIENTSLLL